MAETPDSARLRLRYSAVSDLGRYRKENQDSGYASDHLLVVADGVGGAAYGDVASSAAVHLLRRLDAQPREEMLPALAGAVQRVHDRLAEMVEQDAELDGTSTTVTAALFDGHRLGFVHVGDSRAYLLHDGVLQQVTKDHTLVQTLVDEGRITEADSRVHPHRNIILRAVDSMHDPEPDLFDVELHPGDRVLLCSDGCSGAVTDDQIQALLGEGTVDTAALGLVQASLDGGTTDNVTVVVAEVVPADVADDPETSAAAAVGPMLVGAAAAQPRRGGGIGGGVGGGRGLFRHRQSDTGEMEPVPAGPAAEPVDPEEARYLPRPPRRHTGLRRLLLVLVPLLLLVGVAAAGYVWSQNQYYVAADGPQVAIYQGVQVDIPGLQLSHPYRTAELRVEDLSPFNQQQVTDGIVADDLADAQRILGDLVTQSTDCPPATPAPSATPSSGPSATPSPGPSGSATPTRRASPRASATAQPGPRGGPAPSPSAGPSTRAPASPSATPTAGPSSSAGDCAEGGTP